MHCPFAAQRIAMPHPLNNSLSCPALPRDNLATGDDTGRPRRLTWAGPALPRDNLATGDDTGRPRRLTWAVLMRRTWGIEILVCPRCAGPMRLVAVVEDPAVARRILSHLGLAARAPPRGRPWRRCAGVALPSNTDGIDPPSTFT
jgi:hypothetical protein